ncbi:MAG: tRNA (adenosine(37)-N6)-threonylcarbamoyltransferase complex ATPase subunit type 1 TsaE [Candidatus Latescibacter sp.]|nr:tRNA (adenosine(37)-N6)-threonylcarbamoyltransferase complex ATPase subunit type 1 TsaE [Candidatus Latescibacter sp.]
MKEIHFTNSEGETTALAAAFARTLRSGDVVALTGELGAGKTVFAKGIASALKVEGEVTSPTFTLINEHRGEVTLYHMDLYRLNSLREMLDIGVEEYLYSDGICLVEWAEKMGKNFPANAIRVSIRYGSDNDNDHSRAIEIERNTIP